MSNLTVFGLPDAARIVHSGSLDLSDWGTASNSPINQRKVL